MIFSASIKMKIKLLPSKVYMSVCVPVGDLWYPSTRSEHIKRLSSVFLGLILHVLASRLKLVCSLCCRSRPHYPLRLHLSWSPGIYPRLRIFPVSVDSSAIPSAPNYPFHFPTSSFLSLSKIKTPTCKGRDEEGWRGGGSSRGRKEKRFFFSVSVWSWKAAVCSAVHRSAFFCFLTLVLSPLTLTPFVSACSYLSDFSHLSSTLNSHYHAHDFSFLWHFDYFQKLLSCKCWMFEGKVVSWPSASVRLNIII